MLVWNQKKDLCLLKEIAVEGALQHKAKSRERGTSWLNVANKLAPSFPDIEIMDRKLKEEELKERREEREKQREERVMFVQQLKTMQDTNVSQLTHFMHQQEQQQHQQQQQFAMMQQQMITIFQQQQQQTKLLIDLLKNDH